MVKLSLKLSSQSSFSVTHGHFIDSQVILELVETEQTYVENLARLMKTYFEPLSDSVFFSNSDIRYLGEVAKN